MSNKTIITFGSEQLKHFDIEDPMKIMLVIDADEETARERVSQCCGIGNNFAFSYKYDDYASKFKSKYGMIEITLEELKQLHRKTMKNVYIVATKKNNLLGFDFSSSDVFSTKEEAEKNLTGLEDERLVIVREVFVYLHEYLDEHILVSFPNDDDILNKVYEFCENITDETLREEYFAQFNNFDEYNNDVIYDINEFLDKKISQLQSLKVSR